MQAAPANNLSAEEAVRFVSDWADSYDAGSDKFFDSLAPRATVFAISVPTRISSRDEYRKGFAQNFKAAKARNSQILDPAVSLVAPNTALVTCHNRVQVDGTVSTNRLTILLSKHDGRLQIDHLHVSPLATPRVPTVGGEELLILEERVSTAIGAVGTPK